MLVSTRQHWPGLAGPGQCPGRRQAGPLGAVPPGGRPPHQAGTSTAACTSQRFPDNQCTDQRDKDYTPPQHCSTSEGSDQGECCKRVSVWSAGRSWRDGGDGVRDAAQDACLVRQIRDIFRYGEKVAFVCSLLEVKKKNSDLTPYKDIHHHVMEKIYDISSEYAAKPFETKRLSKTRNLTKPKILIVEL